MFILIPTKVDVPITRPWMNWVIIGAIICISFSGFVNAELFMKFAGIKAQPRRLSIAQEQEPLELTTKDFPLPVLAITSSLLHAGLFHLAGNMLFLWVFGKAITYKFGQIRYLALYLICAMAGGLAHYAFDGRPAVGASGAINGIVGAFLVFFPRNNVTMLWIGFPIPPLPLFRWFSISSLWIILYWFAWDVLFLILGSETSVALWAHVGGFVCGFAIASVCAWTGWIKPEADEETIFHVLGISR